jgi:hypothetical protein
MHYGWQITGYKSAHVDMYVTHLARNSMAENCLFINSLVVAF